MSRQRQTVITAALVSCVLLAAAVAGWRLHTTNRARALALFQEQQLHTAQAVASTLLAEMNGLARTLRTIGNGIGDEREPRALQQRLDRQLQCEQPPCFSSLALYDHTATALYGTGRSVGIDGQALRGSLDWTLDPANATRIRTLISSSSAPALVMLTPVTATEPSQRPALLAGEVDLDAVLYGHGRNQEPGTRPTVLVLDAAGNVVFHSQHPEMRLNNVRARSARCFSCHESLDYVDRILAERKGVIDYSLRGAPHLAAFTPVEVHGQSWVAAVMTPAENAVIVLSSERRQFGILALATIVVLAIGGRLTWKAGRRRLHAEAEAIRRSELESGHSALVALNTRLEGAVAQWRSIIDTIDAAIVVLDRSGHIERMNRAASDMLPGESFSWLHEPSERLRDYPPWDAALALARDVTDRDEAATARVQYAGAGRTWDVWCRQAHRPNEASAVVMVARDVTAALDLQESLRRAETASALASLVAGVAHEIRAALAAISSLADSSTTPLRDEAAHADALRREVTRLTSLTNELVEYGTPTKSVLRPHQLSAVVQQAVRRCEGDAENRGVRIVTCARADGEAWIDPDRFVRVLVELIQNALQHAPEGTDVTVTVSLSRRKRTVLEISVRDHGPGFQDQDLPRVFLPFFTRRTGGFGLGLAICERIVSEHHATMVAANHPEGGAIVSVLIPLTDPARSARVWEGAQLC